MLNVFAAAVTFIDRLLPASESRRRELRIFQSRRDSVSTTVEVNSCIQEAEAIAARAWLVNIAPWMREVEQIAERESLSDTRPA